MGKHLFNSLCFIALFVLYAAPQGWAQTPGGRVSGTVTDSVSGEPLFNVSVIEKGTNNGVSTDDNGRFSIAASRNATLVFSYLGYVRQEIPLNGKTSLNVQMSSDANQLDEIVVVGYGTQSKKEFTGSAARIAADELKEIPVQSFDQAMVGRAAGVNISVPNGVLNNAPVIRIRGINSISLSSYPLVVVDGIPITSGDVSSNGNVPNNPLADINPADIESIDVLKDAASTSIYGSRAAAGVLLITTKRGKQGVMNVNYDGWVGMTSPVRLPKLLDAQQYMDIKNESVLNSKILAGNADNPNVASELFFPSYNADGSLVNTNWYDHIYQTGVSHSHSLNMSGGSEKTTYFFSANTSDQEGILQKNTFKRHGIRFNIDHQVTPWLKLTGSANYTNSLNQSPNSGSRAGNAQLIVGAARMSYILAPNVPAYDPDGRPHINRDLLNGPIGNGANNVVSQYYNPIALFELAKYTAENDRLLANVGATFTLAKGLTFTTNYAVDRLKTADVTSLSPEQGSSSSTNGSVTNVSGLRNNWNFTNNLNYDIRFDQHHISALAGYDAQVFNNNIWGVNVTQAVDPFFIDYQGTWRNIAATTGANELSERAFLSYFSRLTYDFNDRYFFTFNFRRDGNSQLGLDKKWGNFGGASAGWALSEEDFYKNSSFANFMNALKLRASWGRVGNGNLNNLYGSLELFRAGLYATSGTWNFQQAGNPMLGWETSEQTNVGLDFSLLNSRLSGEVTYFSNNVNGLILSVPQTPSKGIPSNQILANVGSLTNKGLEFALNGDVIRSGKFSWNSAFNITFIRNEVTSLVNDGDRILATTSTESNIFNVTEVGRPVGTLFGAITDGVNPDNGRLIFVNAAGERVQFSHIAGPGDSRWSYLDGSPAPAITAADYQPMGNALPTYYGGFINTLRYGSFDLAINFSFSGGNYIMNGNTGTWLDQRHFNNSTKVLDRWTTPGQVTDVPRLVYNDNFAAANIPNISAYVEKGDFIRLQNVMLGYKLPAAFLSKAYIKGLRVYAQATNVFLFTGYSGVEPESSVNGNTNTSPGIEYNSLGNGRTITFGVNLSF